MFLNRTEKDDIFRLLQSGVPPTELIGAVIRLIRGRADAEPTIGKRCSSIIISSVPQAGIGAYVDYHTNTAVDKIHFSAQVCARYGNSGAWFTLEQALTDVKLEEQAQVVRVPPPATRNRPCPCGSGRKYKHCHGDAKGTMPMDSFSMSGQCAILALPEDGRDIEIVLL